MLVIDQVRRSDPRLRSLGAAVFFCSGPYRPTHRACGSCQVVSSRKCTKDSLKVQPFSHGCACRAARGRSGSERPPVLVDNQPQFNILIVSQRGYPSTNSTFEYTNSLKGKRFVAQYGSSPKPSEHSAFGNWSVSARYRVRELYRLGRSSTAVFAAAPCPGPLLPIEKLYREKRAFPMAIR
jgi:hypothetical protein